ncbi:MAG: hypothetical protein RLZZ04_916 [Cyanobacteriota bacterium]|jgi:hypothetical protein
MYRYTAYGLNISSDLSLPELQKSNEDKGADIIIRFGKVNWSLPETLESWSYFQLDGDRAYLCWRVVGKFLVSAGKEIIIEPFANVQEQVMRLPLLGSVLAMALHQRQFLILHGSAVAINDGAAIFIGAKGQGKSTMTATLYGRGHQLITDDVAALKVNNGGVHTLIPGFPQIKLWPEAAKAALGDEAESLRKIHPKAEKRARPILERFSATPIPVRRIYLLGEGDIPRIKPLEPQAAMTSLIANSYIPMLLGEEFKRDQQTALHFHQCINLTKSIPIYRLERPRSLDLLNTIAYLVEEDLAALVAV